MTYFIKWTFRKSGPWTFTKSGLYAKIDCIGQKHLYDKLEVAGFKCDNNVRKNCGLKTPKSGIFGFKIKDFAQNFAYFKIRGC